MKTEDLGSLIPHAAFREELVERNKEYPTKYAIFNG